MNQATSSLISGFATRLAALLVLAGAIPLAAQESLVVLGNVGATGTLDASRNTVSGVVASARTAVGDYTVTVTAAGAFAGAAAADFLPFANLESVSSDDLSISGGVVSVTDDVLTLRFRVGDVEQSSSAAFTVATDAPFYFAVRRIDPLASGSDSRHLIATGIVSSSGVLAGGFGLGGVTVSSLRADTGDYFVTLTKAGAFASDSTQDYLLFLSPIAVAEDDVAIRGDAASATSDDSISFNIHTDDVQNAAGSDNPVPRNRPFTFAIFSLESLDIDGAPASALVAAQCAVNGASGALESAGSVLPGAVLSSSRTGEGRYRVEIAAPGVFAGVSPTRFVPIVSLRTENLIDEIIAAQAQILDPGTLVIDVTANDVQDPGATNGVGDDESFSLVLFDSAPTLIHDLSLGRRNNPATFRGAGILNTTGAGQGVNLPLLKLAPRRVFFAAKHAGLALDDLRLKGQGVAGPFNNRFFRTTGPRRNVTAEVNIGAVVAENLRPGDQVEFEGVFRYRNKNNRPNRTIRMRAISRFRPASVDVNRIFVQAR